MQNIFSLNSMRALALIALLAPASFMIAQPAHAQDRIQAKNRSECASASQRFSRQRYDAAMADVKRNFEPRSKIYIAREKQFSKQWRVNRYNRNVQKCNSWFDSGRTIPYTPG